MTGLLHQHSLKELNSFGVDAVASLYAAPENEEALIHLLKEYAYQQLPFLVMGEGSNILFKENYEGLIIRPGMKGVEVLEENDQEVLIRVGAAENWDNWVSLSISKGWFGLENLSLIPGSVGSAPVQNIGAYGVELKDYFERADAWDLQEKKLVQLDRPSCKFGYRSSIFKHEHRDRYIITHVVFRLRKQAQLQLNYGPVQENFSKAGGTSPLDLREVIMAIRRQKLPDPQEIGNAGSYFKNPMVDRTVFKCIRVDYPDIPNFPDANNQVKIPAGWLIEQAGWKGKRIGNVGTWPYQALVIVNYGNASGQEILDFSEKLRTDVDKQFGIYLEREVNVI
jgi:UDP-N-acetylmuramate dehydrogenase